MRSHTTSHRAFERAAQLDPKLAWALGIALALGPNINRPLEGLARRAYQEVQLARSWARCAATSARDRRARRRTPPSRPIASRSTSPQAGMGEVVRAGPTIDAATPTPGVMDLTPWDYWKDGSPARHEELVTVLERCGRDPSRGATTITSMCSRPRRSRRALGAARRLEGLAPAAGHLATSDPHLPRTGDYERSSGSTPAASVDRDYIRKYKVEGFYPVMYFNHNLHMAAVSYGMEGRYADAMRNAREVTANATPVVKDMPMADMFTPTTALIQIRFRRWKDVLAAPRPAEHMLFSRIVWHFGRGLALSSQRDAAGAQKELDALDAVAASIPSSFYVGLNRRPRVEVPRASSRPVAAARRASRARARPCAAVTVEDGCLQRAADGICSPLSLGSALLRPAKRRGETVGREELVAIRARRALFDSRRPSSRRRRHARPSWSGRSWPGRGSGPTRSSLSRTCDRPRSRFRSHHLSPGRAMPVTSESDPRGR